MMRRVINSESKDLIYQFFLKQLEEDWIKQIYKL
jgi:hypothetical protein